MVLEIGVTAGEPFIFARDVLRELAKKNLWRFQLAPFFLGACPPLIIYDLFTCMLQKIRLRGHCLTFYAQINIKYIVGTFTHKHSRLLTSLREGIIFWLLNYNWTIFTSRDGSGICYVGYNNIVVFTMEIIFCRSHCKLCSMHIPDNWCKYFRVQERIQLLIVVWIPYYY